MNRNKNVEWKISRENKHFEQNFDNIFYVFVIYI